ncbi:MAG: lysophospholipid acyltransferase family protein [Acidimicrobiales bacterium]|nr:lysophospholipid acyltransferase family protein [Acidimicrobiales bacterium]
MRPQVNRIVILAMLAVALPAIAGAERVRPGAGRALALRVIRLLARLCGVRFEIHGADRLDEKCSYVLVPNHTSPIDIPAILMARPDARFVAAAELFRIPLLGAAMRALGTTPITRGDRRAAHRQLVTLSRPVVDRELVIFPEGRISQSGDLGLFRSGAFLVAINSRAPVVPLAIRGTSSVLPPNGRLKLRPGVIRVEILAPAGTTGLTGIDRKTLAKQVRTDVIDALSAG